MEYSEQQLSRILVCGMCRYSMEHCAIILDLHSDVLQIFYRDFEDPKSDVAREYAAGVVKSEWLIDQALLKRCESGDIAAINLFEKRLKLRATKK